MVPDREASIDAVTSRKQKQATPVFPRTSLYMRHPPKGVAYSQGAAFSQVTLPGNSLQTYPEVCLLPDSRFGQDDKRNCFLSSCHVSPTRGPAVCRIFNTEAASPERHEVHSMERNTDDLPHPPPPSDGNETQDLAHARRVRTHL